MILPVIDLLNLMTGEGGPQCRPLVPGTTITNEKSERTIPWHKFHYVWS